MLYHSIETCQLYLGFPVSTTMKYRYHRNSIFSIILLRRCNWSSYGAVEKMCIRDRGWCSPGLRRCKVGQRSNGPNGATRTEPPHMIGKNVREIEYLRDDKIAEKSDIRFQKYEWRKQKEDSRQKLNWESKFIEANRNMSVKTSFLWLVWPVLISSNIATRELQSNHTAEYLSLIHI